MGSVEVRSSDRLLANRYQLQRLLARGGMADVYRGRDALLGREVAIKLLRGDGYDDHARYEAEVRTLAALNHPGLVALYDAGSDGGVNFFVMELVEGSTLAAYLRGRRLSPARTAAIGLPLAEALAHVHGRGVVHRDLKPANVLMSTDNRVRLADFGIARLIDGARITATGLALGTAAYLAPEQVTGGPVGAPADVYALGLVVLECLTGRREYEGTSMEAALARLHRAPSMPADLPGRWEQLLRDMTSRAPGDRPTADVVADRLRSLASVEEAAPPTLPYVPLPRSEATPAPTTRLPVDQPAHQPLHATSDPTSEPAPGSAPGPPPPVGSLRGRRFPRRLLPVAVAAPLVAGAIAVAATVSGSAHSSGSTPVPPAAVPSPLPQPATEVPQVSSVAPAAPGPRPAANRTPASTTRRSAAPVASPAPVTSATVTSAPPAASPVPSATVPVPSAPFPAPPGSGAPSAVPTGPSAVPPPNSPRGASPTATSPPPTDGGTGSDGWDSHDGDSGGERGVG